MMASQFKGTNTIPRSSWSPVRLPGNCRWWAPVLPTLPNDRLGLPRQYALSKGKDPPLHNSLTRERFKGFYSLTRIPGYISIASLILCAFMLLCFAVLPPQKTGRQYLNVNVCFAVLLFEVGIQNKITSLFPFAHHF